MKQPTLSQSPKIAAAPPDQFAAYPGYDPDPCYHAKNKDAADLCAQWRSAIAAEKATLEARRATTWSIITTLLNAISLAAVTAALLLTIKANNLTAKTLTGFTGAERAHLILENVRSTGLQDDGAEAFLIFDVINHGRTPGWVKNIAVETFVTDGLPMEPPSITTMPILQMSIAPNQSRPFSERLNVSREDFHRALNGTLFIAYGVIRYQDIFGATHETHFGYQINLLVFEKVITPLPMSGFWRYT
jgi:hypothetical protein